MKTSFPLPCPFCGSDDITCTSRWSRYHVGCTNDECVCSPQVSGFTAEEAWNRWNTRMGRTPAEQEIYRRHQESALYLDGLFYWGE